MSIATKKTNKGRRFVYSPPLLPGFGLDGVEQGRIVRVCAGPGVGRMKGAWRYCEDAATGQFLGMCPTNCLQPVGKNE